MTLLEEVEVEISDDLRNQLEKLDAYDISPTITEARDAYPFLSPSEMRSAAESLKRLFALNLIRPEQKYGVPSPLDSMLHAQIGSNGRHRSFCQAIGMQPRHVPFDLKVEQNRRELTDIYRATVKTYDEVFTTRDHRWWPDATYGNCDCVHAVTVGNVDTSDASNEDSRRRSYVR